MKDDLVERIMGEVIRKMGGSETESPAAAAPAAPAPAPAPAALPKKACALTEYVGTAIGNTIGLVIANVDAELHKQMGIDPKYRSIGIVGARTGAGPHIFAADEAVKATNSEVLVIELPRDTEGGGGHGSLIIFGAEDVSDARRAVEVTLQYLDQTFGDVYGTAAGHLEFQYTARASFALNKAFGAPIGQSFAITVGAPAAIGVVLADTAAKAATVDPIAYSSPAKGTSFSNEVIFAFSGDSGAVRQAVIAARDVGKQLLGALSGEEPKSSTTPYI
ncbi:propanediol utilization microcompartment protein PduB [Roseospira marina]|uniref:Propanediol utilization microcompartment protein PduB n=1 Tax=Roseospira marina TaxID=140057 RepID=A0A5M6IH25_9PROT|nr:propanediol utilization microcompartment protein PduB [Roseospira marina]KAA5607059.1 propanediol utilization microcompartment protein PduB [Roseospira marina]MBB4312751.1 microcompartment protein PduB [Roseospira marina]MBB5086476.1 microcompartment protein PduB [Roseospira marina]